jgi:hypothetical protein
MASSDAFSESPNFALEGDFPEDVELIPTQQLFFFKSEIRNQKYFIGLKSINRIVTKNNTQ